MSEKEMFDLIATEEDEDYNIEDYWMEELGLYSCGCCTCCGCTCWMYEDEEED